MGILASFIVTIIIYIKTFKAEFDEEIVKKTSDTMFAWLIVIIVIAVIISII